VSRADQRDEVQSYRPLPELVPAHWQTGAIEAADGTHIHYTRTGGSKPAVLLLHGIQASGLTWLRTAQALEAAYDVVMPDARGHGPSRLGDEGVTVDTLVQDMLTLIRVLNLDAPHVVGHSMGADIAGRLAVAQAARALVLVDPALHNVAAGMNIDVDNPPPWMAAIYATMRALRTQPHAERMVTGLKLLPPGTVVSNESDYVSLVDAMAQFDLAFYRSAVGMGYLFEADDLLARITCPALLLTARPMMPGVDVEAGVARLRRSLRALEHIHFADSGHFIMFDQFERFIDILTRFLAEH
jgi:pimeloyl-ACP methyl ester carboxylesterase